MGKLKVLSGQEVCAILEAYGFRPVRQRGRHMLMQRRDQNGTTTIPVPNHDTVKAGVLSAIIRQSGVPRGAFEA